MPYSKRRSDDCPSDKPWGVFKKDDGKRMGCHATEEQASKQIAALYANEGKK